MKEPLRRSAEEFTAKLNNVITNTINTDVRFTPVIVQNGKWAFKQACIREPENTSGRTDGFPLIREEENPKTPALLLHARFIVEMDSEGVYMQVKTSTIGLWVDTTGGKKGPRPLVRVEYDRAKTLSGAAAHVHLHAYSPELAWIYGSSGRPALNLHSLHFPVGGRRFRPTLEDFLFFLYNEKGIITKT